MAPIQLQRDFFNFLGRRASWPAWLVLAISWALTVGAWYGLKSQALQSANQQFELHVRDVVGAIEERLRQHEQILLGSAGLFAASGEVSRAEWRTYVGRLNLSQNYPGIQGVGFSQLITPRQLPDHIAAMRAQGFPQYTVRPPGERDTYTSIVYLEPFTDRNLAAFGFDMMSEATRAKAMRRAAETGRTAITGKVKLVQETHGKQQAGFLMYVPIYANAAGQTLATPQERWAALRGFVYSPYRMDDLMRDVLGEHARAVDFAIHDGTVSSGDSLMHSSAANGADASGLTPARLRAQRTITAYEQPWTIELESRSELDAASSSPLHLLVLLLGGSVSVLLFLMVASISTRRAQIEALALQMTAEIRRNEERLRINEARLNEAQHTAQVGSWELDLGTGALFWTDETFHLFEIDKAKFPATYEGFLNAIHPDDRDAVNQAYTDSLVSRQPYEIKHRLRMDDGRVKWVHERCSSDFDTAGKPLRSRGTVQDITQLTVAERAAQESARFTQSILDNAIDGIITINETGTVQTFNRAAESIFGYAAAEVIGRNVNMLMPEPYHSQHDSYLKNYRDGGAPRIIGIGREVEGRRKDGGTFPLDLAVSRSEHQGTPLFIGLVRDITERKRVEKMKTEFISTVSHELRTPLTSIRGALGLITGGALGQLPAQAGVMLKIASNNTERLLLLINDILDIQKIESGQMVFRFNNLEVSPFIQGALHDMAGYGDQHGVHYVVTHDIADAVVYADQDRLSQVLANLLSNATKFSPSGAQVEVSITYQGDRLRISVTDHGPGIPEDFQSKLFDRFTQADSSDTRSKGGTGLGLAITKAIVEKHGGSISFDTQAGVGTSFHVDLPLIASSKIAPALDGHPPAGERRPRVLVVEDDPDVAALIQRMLLDEGFDSDVAYDAPQARALLAQKKDAYKLVTLDIVLPGEDGVSLLTSLREDAATRDLPVVVLSVKADEVRQQLNGGAVGVLDWLRKPIDQKRLLDVVRRAGQAGQNGQMVRVLHVEDDPDIHKIVSAMLHGQCELVAVGSLEQARQCLAEQAFDLVLLDIGLPDGSGLCLVDAINQHVHPPKVVIFSAQDVSAADANKVNAVLVKSRTSNEDLLKTLKGLMTHD